ncbi:class I SAM-dependent methyltransferase, partial [Staphylococcus sp. SIMBA_130]
MASSKEERVDDVFQTISKRYDVMNSVISFQRHKAWRKDTMRLMDVQKGSSALDVCCGTADWTIAMADAVGESGSAIGLDFSENMLEVGHVKVNEKRKENVT